MPRDIRDPLAWALCPDNTTNSMGNWEELKLLWKVQDKKIGHTYSTGTTRTVACFVSSVLDWDLCSERGNSYTSITTCTNMLMHLGLGHVTMTQQIHWEIRRAFLSVMTTKPVILCIVSFYWSAALHSLRIPFIVIDRQR
jgi:hypothetical protein